MNIRPYRHIERRKSRKIKVGNVFVGGDAPISVQTMTNTLTTDIHATLEQINSSSEAGADIIRVSCPDKESTQALKQIVKLSPIPIVADIHFHYLRAIEAADAGAACLRINPGNIGSPSKVKEVINSAKQIHHSLLKVSTENHTVELTPSHPLYIKNYGLTSLYHLKRNDKLSNYKDMIGKVEILVWNSEKEKSEYQKLTQIEKIEGEFETHTILKLENGTTYIANGFVTSVY